MVFDTTISANNFDEEIKKFYFNNCIILRKDFCNWIDKIGLKNDLIGGFQIQPAEIIITVICFIIFV